MQRFINTALDSYWLWLLARLCLMVIFISSGLAKLFDIEGSLAEMRAAGLHPAWLFNLASAAVLLTGSVLILLNRWVWLGAGMLSVFLILTIAIVHLLEYVRSQYADFSLLRAGTHHGDRRAVGDGHRQPFASTSGQHA